MGAGISPLGGHWWPCSSRWRWPRSAASSASVAGASAGGQLLWRIRAASSAQAPGPSSALPGRRRNQLWPVSGPSMVEEDDSAVENLSFALGGLTVSLQRSAAAGRTVVNLSVVDGPAQRVRARGSAGSSGPPGSAVPAGAGDHDGGVSSSADAAAEASPAPAEGAPADHPEVVAAASRLSALGGWSARVRADRAYSLEVGDRQAA